MVAVLTRVTVALTQCSLGIKLLAPVLMHAPLWLHTLVSMLALLAGGG